MGKRYNEIDIQRDIENHYFQQYKDNVKRQKPWLNRLETALFLGGGAIAFIGVLGIVAAGTLAFFSAPFLPVVLPALAGSAALGFAGVASVFKGVFKISGHFERLAYNAVRRDIDNLKLVKTYLTDVLPLKNQELAQARDQEETSFDKQKKSHLKELDRFVDKQADLDKQRKKTLEVLSTGFEVLENRIGQARNELDFFRKEAREALGEEFGASAQKPQPADVVAQPVRTLSSPSWLK